MPLRPFQFGIANLMWWVFFAALNCWLVSLGAWGTTLAVVIDKHVLVAYVCWSARVDRRIANRCGLPITSGDAIASR